MAKQKSAVLLGFCSLLMTAAGACGDLIKFDLPEHSYTFDVDKVTKGLPDLSLPSVACTDDQGCCDTASLAMPGLDCTPLICDPVSNTCALTTTVETKPPQVVDLKKEVSALSSFNNQSVVDINITRILYDVTDNSVNVDLPPIELFVAPQGTASASDPAAIRFGTIPATPAFTTISNGRVTLDPAGRKAFVNFAHHFGTPFVIMGKAVLVAPGGTPTPTGVLSVKIRGQLSASPSI